MRIVCIVLLALLALSPFALVAFLTYAPIAAGEGFMGATAAGHIPTDRRSSHSITASSVTTNSKADRTPEFTSDRFSHGVQTPIRAKSPGPDFLLTDWTTANFTRTDRRHNLFLGDQSGGHGCLACLPSSRTTATGNGGLGSAGGAGLGSAGSGVFQGGGQGRGVVGVANVRAVSVPERAILPRLPKFIKLGLGINARITYALQRTTTWLAAAILRAPHSATEIHLPAVTVKVIEDCAGRQTMMLMLLVAALIAAVMPARRAPWAFGLFIAAALMALEANALRVAGIAIGLEQTAGALTHDWKDWIQLGTTGFALTQLVGLGRLVARDRTVPRPVTI
jgi:exosortase/archaeosortase family protein